MSYPPPLKEVLPGKAEPGSLLSGREDDLSDGPGRFLGNSLIRIEYEDPGIPAAIDGKLFLRAESPPRFLEDIAAELPGDLNGIVPAAGIDDDDLRGERNTLQAPGQISLLIAGNDGYGDRRHLRRIHNGCSAVSLLDGTSPTRRLPAKKSQTAPLHD